MEPTDIIQYIKIARKRQWMIIIPFLITLLGGLTHALITPKIFKAQTLIMIVQQKVPQSYVKAIVSLSMEERLRTIQQQVMSRTNLEGIIQQNELFNTPAASQMLLEDKVLTVQKRIEINVTRGTAFTISFQDQDPEKARDVANTLAAKFIGENLKIREGQALGTSQFLTEELQSVKNKLEKKEGLLKDYHKKYMGAMPEHLTTNLNMLSKVQTRIDQLTTNINAAENRKLTIQQQMANMKMMQKQMGDSGNDSLIEFDMNDISQESEELTILRKRIASLKSKYTDKHPDVMRLQKMIEKIEADNAAALEESEPELETELETDAMEVGLDFGMTGDFLKPQLEQIDQEISRLKKEIKKLKLQAEVYQKRIEETPKREQELISLNRDYNNMVNLYDSLLNRKLEADIAVSMEKKQKGEQFRIVDPARLPQKPIKPNLRKIMLVSLGLGLALGCALVFLMENLNPAYNSPEEIETALKLPVLVSLPFQHTKMELKSRIRKNILAYSATGIVFILFAIGIVVATKGLDELMEKARNLF